MKYIPAAAVTVDEDVLKQEYAAARVIGNLRIADHHLFFRSGLKTYYIPYGEVRRCFRRVQLVPARMCCGRGDLAIENLVVCDRDDHELAQVQLPGEKAGKAALEEFKKRIPGALFNAPIDTRAKAQ